jgi:hypothetical protein
MTDKENEEISALKFSSKVDYEYKLNELIGFEERDYLDVYF